MRSFDKNKVEFALWCFFAKIVNLLGFKQIHKFAKLLTIVFYYLIPLRKTVVVENLKKAFPNKSEKEIKKLAFNNFLSVAITFLEIMAFQNISKEEIFSLVKVNNLKLAKQKVAENKGVILLTAHIANWELGALIMGLSLDTQINVLVKKQRNKIFADWMSGIREKFTNKEVPLGASVRELYKTLLKGGIVGIVGDQRGRKDEGIVVDFFNQPTTTFQGFASLGIKNKVPILVVLGERLPNGKYLMNVEEIGYDNLPEKLSDKVVELNQRYMSILENKIRKNPEQWLWMHNIWKY